MTVGVICWRCTAKHVHSIMQTYMYRPNRGKQVCLVSIILKQIIHFAILCYISYVFLVSKLLLSGAVRAGKLSSPGRQQSLPLRRQKRRQLGRGYDTKQVPQIHFGLEFVEEYARQRNINIRHTGSNSTLAKP